MRESRRIALKRLAAAGVGTVLAPVIIRGQSAPITIAGRPVEIAVAPIGASTVRISVRPIVNGQPQPVVNRGALVAAAEQRTKTDLAARVVEGTSPTVVVTRNGRPVQTLTFNNTESSVRLVMGQSQIFGLGEGGPQFDRRGSEYTTRNGQGGYQLRTHGGRVPIQWLVSRMGGASTSTSQSVPST